MTGTRLVVVLLTVVLALGLAAWYVLRGGREETDVVRVSGNVEVTDVQVSFKIPGWVQSRPVDEGQTVAAGRVVAELETADLKVERTAQEAALAAAQAILAELVAGSRPQEIAAAEAAVEAAKANAFDAETNFRRISRLERGDLAAQQEYDTGQAHYEAAQAQLRETQERYKLVKEGPRKEQIAQAKARVQQAQSAVDLVKTRLDYAVLRSPLSGVVLSKNIEPGEYVVPGTPVVTIGDLVNVWVRAYINERDLGRVKLGLPVRVVTDTYSNKIYWGRVSFISSEAEFTPKNVQTQEERVKLVYRVKIDIKNPNMELKPGMPADAEILLKSMKSTSEPRSVGKGAK